ncbi:MAG: chromate transporter [Elusimicrobiaceae bacterium]|nr:chromate transporter [Elusimicrobiaceae bacterium]
MIYWQIFKTFFKIGLFNFGGGYPMISFIQNEVVLKYGWLSNGEFTDIVAVSQMTPGPVGINMATYTGYAATDTVWGAFLATFAVCLPSFIVMILVARYFLKYQDKPAVQAVFKGLRPAIIGLIAAAALVLCDGQNFIDNKSYLIFIISFRLLLRFKLHPIGLICLAGITGIIFY